MSSQLITTYDLSILFILVPFSVLINLEIIIGDDTKNNFFKTSESESVALFH